MNQKIFICDVDNCISDDSHRMHLLPDSVRCYARTSHPIIDDPKPRNLLTDDDFHQYHMNCIFDVPRNINKLYNDGVADQIWMVTAMPQSYNHLRWWWFAQHIISPVRRRMQLIMRPNGDHSPSEELKVRLLKEKFKMDHRDPSEVVLAIDDRNDVLDAYRDEFNFPTMRVVINE